MSEKKQLTFEAIAIKGNVAYASDYDKNGLFKVDMSTGKCEFIRLFDEEPFYVRRLHCAAIWIDLKIYFIPGSANRIYIFYPESNSLESIEIPLPKANQFHFYKPQFKFIRAVKYEDNLWLIPCSYPGIIKLNVNSSKIHIFDEWLEKDEYFFRSGISVEGKKIIMANGKSNALLIFDMEKESGIIEHVGMRNNGVMSICKVENNYWFAPRLPGSIVVWNTLTHTVKEYEDFPSEFISGNIVFSKVYSISDKIEFIPARSNYGLVYVNDNFYVDNSVLLKKYNQSIVEYLFETDDERYFRETGTEKNNRYFKINKTNNSLSEYSFYYVDNRERERCIISVMSSGNKIIRENKYVGLKEFIRGLM